MKLRILTLIVLSCVCLLGACSKEDDNIVYETLTFSLSTIPEDGTSIKSDTWIITDGGSPSYQDFERLRTALWSAGRSISLELTNITTIPNKALCTSPSYLVSIKADKAITIDESAFSMCDKLEYVDLPQVTTIGQSAFSRCWALTYIELPKATIIEDSAFDKCNVLESVKLPNAENVGMYVFYDCYSLESLTIATASTVEVVNSAAFRDIILSNVDLITGKDNGTTISGLKWKTPDTSGYWEHGDFKSISYGVDGREDNYYTVSFINNYNSWVGSQTVNGGSCVTEPYVEAQEGYSIYAWYTNKNQTDIWSFDTPVYENLSLYPKWVKENSLALADISADNYPQDENVWNISDAYISSTSTMDGLIEALKCAATEGRQISLEFPNLREFTQSAFYQEDLCLTSLYSISAPNVTDVEYMAFMNCTNLTEVYLPKVITISKNAFYYTNIASADFPTALSVYGNAFCKCYNLSHVNLPKVSYLGDYFAFSECTSLTSIELPKVTQVGGYAFSECTNLVQVVLPQVTMIYGYAFNKCSSLSNLSLATDSGVSVQYVGTWAFRDIDTTEIDLCLGIDNYVSGNWFKGYEFKSITIE